MPVELGRSSYRSGNAGFLPGPVFMERLKPLPSPGSMPASGRKWVGFVLDTGIRLDLIWESVIPK